MRAAVLVLFSTLISVMSFTAGTAEARTRNIRDSQLRYDPLISRPQSSDDAKNKTTKNSVVKPIPPPPQKLWYFNYFAEFTGPSADFALPLESYSFGADYYAPMKIFQSTNLGYNLTSDHRIGFELTADSPLQSEVLDAYDNTYSSDFVIYDPVLYYQYFRFLSNPYVSVDGKISLDLPLSDNSKKNKYITGFYNGYVVNFTRMNPKFYFAINLDLYLFFFENPVGWNRFSTAVGHNWGWYISKNWSLDTVTIFDFALASQGNNGYTFNENSVDRLKVTLRFQPIVNKIQLGAFIQAPLYQRSLSRAAVGLNFNYWL